MRGGRSRLIVKILFLLPGLTAFSLLVADGNRPLFNILQFKVHHRDLAETLFIFSIGAALFIALIVVVIRFAYTEQ